MSDGKEKQSAIESLTRRDFLRSTAVGAAGAVLGGGAAACSPFAEAGHQPEANESLPAGKSKVVLIRHEKACDKDGRPVEEKIDEMLAAAMIELSGQSAVDPAWARYIQPDDTVGVKVNVMMTPTSPELSRAIVRGVMRAGVPEDRIILWDRDSAGHGLSGATAREKHFGFDSRSLSKIITDEATALVNVPGMKVHWLAGIAVSLKNWVGALSNINVADVGAAYKIHGDSCAGCAAIPAIPAIRSKSRLIVVDALRPLFHGGPQVNPRYLWPYRALVVGSDPVAVDAVCIRILEAKRREFHGQDWPISPPPKHVFVAEQKYRLGHAQMQNIELVKLGWEEGMLV